MVTAFVTTKWPILVDSGFWTMAHEYRTDFAMTLLLIYLLIYGSGSLSIDSKINKSLKPDLRKLMTTFHLAPLNILKTTGGSF
jgi:hypothetical protein